MGAEERTSQERGNTLPDVLASLREQAGLSRVELGKRSRLSAETIKLIEYGKTRPRIETLWLIAAGLATNRLRGEVDEDQADELFLKLMDATGYRRRRRPAQPEPEAETARPTPETEPREITVGDLRRRIAELTGDRRAAVDLAGASQHWNRFTPDQQQLILLATEAALQSAAVDTEEEAT